MLLKSTPPTAWRPLLCGHWRDDITPDGFLAACTCVQQLLFSSSEVYCPDSQQIPPNKQHLSEAAPHMIFYSSKNTCGHSRTRQLFLLFSVFNYWIKFIVYDPFFCLVEMRLPQFADVTAIAPAPRRPSRGQRHYRGRWSASRSRHRFITLYRKQSQSCFCLSSSRHAVWSLQGAGHAAEELLADKSTNMPTHTYS